MLLWLLAVLAGILLCGGIAVVAILAAYYILSTAKTLRENSRQQTELLQEIKGLLEKAIERGELNDVI